MATASMDRGMLWTDLEGQELNGRWRIKKLVRPEGRAAWFEASDADGTPAMLSVTETLNDEDELLERLKAAAEIRHPNVVAIREAAIVHMGDVPLVIAAMEMTEENLGDVLRERALSAAEARQVLDAVLAGLAAMHGRGLTHGRMDAASVLATGDTVKLRSDCLQIPGDEFAARAAEDIRGVGRIVTQTVTRRIPAGENDPVLQLVPEPLARAARQALTGRASVEEIASLAGMRIVSREMPPAAPSARTNTPAPSPMPAPPAPAAAVPPPARQEPKSESQPQQKQKPVSAEPVRPIVEKAAPPAANRNLITPAQEAPRVIPMPTERARGGEQQELRLEPSLLDDDEPETEKRRSAPWLIVAAATLAVITIFVVYGMLHRKTAATAAHPAAAAAMRPLPAHSATAGKPAASAHPPAASTAARPGWRVVVYTYDHRQDAQRKAQQLASRYGRLQPGVFQPRHSGKYLVTLGQVMSRTGAERLRSQAVRMGLPRDTYAQNFR